MKIVVDYDECEANAVCVGILPEVFEVDDDDNLHLHEEYPADDKLDKPFEFSQLDEKIKKVLALKKTRTGGKAGG